MIIRQNACPIDLLSGNGLDSDQNGMELGKGIKRARELSWVACLYVALALSLSVNAEESFRPTSQDLETIRDRVGAVPLTTKLVILSDNQHRLKNTRAAAMLIASAFAQRYPREKVCLFLETTEKIDDAWAKYKKGADSESDYSNGFSPIAQRLSQNVSSLKVEDAARIYVEPPYYVARFLRNSATNLNAYGVDVDYTDPKVFRPLVENQKPPRSINDNDFVKMFVSDRNRSMASKASGHMKRGSCTRAVMAIGSAHTHQFTGDPKTFPNYTGGSVPGVADLLDRSFTGKPYVVRLSVTSCEEKPCEIKSTSPNNSRNDLELTLPRDFYDSRQTAPRLGEGQYDPALAIGR